MGREVERWGTTSDTADLGPLQTSRTAPREDRAEWSSKVDGYQSDKAFAKCLEFYW
jgi:hypothetical protein